MQIWDVSGCTVAAIAFKSFQTLTGDGRLKLSEHTSFVLHFTIDESPEFSLVGTVWESNFTIPDADVLLLIDEVHPSKFGRINVDRSLNSMSPVESHDCDLDTTRYGRKGFRPVRMEPLPNDSLLMRQLDTIHKVARSHKFQQIALNQHHQPSAKNILADVSRNQILTAWNRVRNMKGQTWNSEQLEVFESVEHLVGGVLLVHGPAGTGESAF